MSRIYAIAVLIITFSAASVERRLNNIRICSNSATSVSSRDEISMMKRSVWMVIDELPPERT